MSGALFLDHNVILTSGVLWPEELEAHAVGPVTALARERGSLASITRAWLLSTQNEACFSRTGSWHEHWAVDS